MQNKTEEYWLAGPVEGVPALLQPIAHALLQANDEIHAALSDFDEQNLWERPYNVASIAFHLQHIPGVLDRMRSYANALPLSPSQLKYLSEEGLELDTISLSGLLSYLDMRIRQFISSLKDFNPGILTEARTVGRKRLPSTVIGLLFHAAEHTMRHTGQLLVTAKVLSGSGILNTDTRVCVCFISELFFIE